MLLFILFHNQDFSLLQKHKIAFPNMKCFNLLFSNCHHSTFTVLSNNKVGMSGTTFWSSILKTKPSSVTCCAINKSTALFYGLYSYRPYMMSKKCSKLKWNQSCNEVVSLPSSGHFMASFYDLLEYRP